MYKEHTLTHNLICLAILNWLVLCSSISSTTHALCQWVPFMHAASEGDLQFPNYRAKIVGKDLCMTMCADTPKISYFCSISLSLQQTAQIVLVMHHIRFKGNHGEVMSWFSSDILCNYLFCFVLNDM